MATNGTALPGGSVLDNAVCLQFSTSTLGSSRKIEASSVVDDRLADSTVDRLGVSKDILNSVELRAVTAEIQNARTWLKAIALPSFFKSGVYLLPLPLVTRVDEELERRRALWQEKVDAFIGAYPGLIERAKAALGAIFNERDYPNVERVRRAFEWETRYLAFSTPGKLKAISGQIFKRETEKAQKDLVAFVDDIKGLLRAQFKGLVDHMVDRLQPAADGKKRIFKDATINNLSEFLSTIDLRNLGNDEELRKLTVSARELLDGVDPEIIRESDDVRKVLAEGFEKVKANLDPLVKDAPRRKFDFGNGSAS